MLFGEYLLEKGIVSEKVLTEALVEQVKTTPSIVELVYEGKCLDDAALLRVLSLQVKEKKGFVEAARKAGLWTEDLARYLEEATIKKRQPLGQILVNQGKVNFETITKALDEYLSVLDQRGQKPAKPGMTSQYEAALSDSLKEDFEAQLAIFNDFETFRSQSEKFPNSVQKLIDGFHLVTEAARSQGAQMSHLLAKELETVFMMLKGREASTMTSDVTKKIFKTAQEGILNLWLLREAIRQEGSEDKILEDEGAKVRMNQVIASCEVIRFDIEML